MWWVGDERVLRRILEDLISGFVCTKGLVFELATRSSKVSLDNGMKSEVCGPTISKIGS